VNIFATKSYFSFLLKSSNQHGIHSPFVYDLITKCFYNKKKYSEYLDISSFRKSLLNSKDTITVEDFGAGSLKFSSNERKISDIAKIAGASFSESKLFFRIVNYFSPKSILEFGTSLGISTFTFNKANNKSEITTIEGSKSIYNWNIPNLGKYNFANTSFLNILFDDYLKTIDNNKKFDLIFIDGNHSYSATIKYFETLRKHTHNDSIIIFDDIHWSEGMDRAWKEIIKNEDVRVSIDTFHFGVVFFRKEQRKEHFIIRA